MERFKFFRDHLEICTVPEVHTYLADLALAQFQVVVDDNFHPVVRYNAMLLISSLNDQDPVRVGPSRATPEPMLRALPVILDEFQKPENSDAIRAAALVGLVRHLDWDNFKTGQPIPPPLKANAVKVLLELRWPRRRPPRAMPVGTNGSAGGRSKPWPMPAIRRSIRRLRRRWTSC